MGALLATETPMIPEDNAILRALFYTLFAAVGGAMGYIMRNLDSGTPIRWSIVALQGVAAGFVGMLVYMLCLELSLSSYWTGIIVGVFGWIGANATIMVLQKLIYKKLGLEGEPKAPEQKYPSIQKPERKED
jgi:hypothetical protein